MFHRSAMGNVHASSPKVESESFPPSPPISMSPPPQSELSKENHQASTNTENPGSVEELHKKCKGMFSHLFTNNAEVSILRSQ